jgi:hypothetical protein
MVNGLKMKPTFQNNNKFKQWQKNHSKGINPILT